MTERREDAGDLEALEWDADGYAGHAGGDGYNEGAADDEEDEDLFPPWFDEWTEPPPRPHLPWYRNVRVLGALIGVAGVALLTSTAVLLTLNSPAEFPIGPRITTAPTAASRAAPAPAPSRRAEVSQPPTIAVEASPSADAEPPAPPAAEPVAVQQVPQQPPRLEVPRDRSGMPEGPRINVTRAPMSFTPTSAPRP